MNDIGKKITEARQKQNLTIEQLGEITKVRHHIIKAIEAGDYSILPEVYMKSFIKTISKYLHISGMDISLPTQTKSAAISNKDIDFKIISTTSETITTPRVAINETKEIIPEITVSKPKPKPKNEEVEKYAELFKKKNVKKVSRVGLLNYFIFSVVIIGIISAVVLTLLNLKTDENTNTKKSNTKLNDTLEVQQPKNNLLSYFDKSDSLTVTAKASDTSWVRVIIDGINYIEVMMKPGQEEKWVASEYFLIDQGNVGSISFYRNGEILPMFGKAGTVVKNIKITKDNVLNTSLQKDTIPIKKIFVPKHKYNTKKVQEKPKTPKLIQESKIQPTPNPLNKNRLN